LEQAGPLNPNQKEFVKHIQQATKTMSELVQNMMSLVQLDLEATQTYEPVDMKELLIEMATEFDLQAKEKLQTLDADYPSEPVYVRGDAFQLRQVFRNLISNAIKYTPQGGNIQVKAMQNNGQVIIQVKDNGYGIPAADLPFIFNRFYRVRSGKASEIEGNGLGLAIVKAIVAEHNGAVNVESEMGKGTCFSVLLPIHKI
jgi:signal transduction histidine kinase